MVHTRSETAVGEVVMQGQRALKQRQVARAVHKADPAHPTPNSDVARLSGNAARQK